MNLKSRPATLEVFCFGLALIMIVGWGFAALYEFDRNVDGFPTAITIIAGLLIVGFWQRRMRIRRFQSRVGKHG